MTDTNYIPENVIKLIKHGEKQNHKNRLDLIIYIYDNVLLLDLDLIRLMIFTMTMNMLNLIASHYL